MCVWLRQGTKGGRGEGGVHPAVDGQRVSEIEVGVEGRYSFIASRTSVCVCV